MKKTYDDKVKKLESEWQVEKECIEREGKEKIEALTLKSKKEVKTA